MCEDVVLVDFAVSLGGPGESGGARADGLVPGELRFGERVLAADGLHGHSRWRVVRAQMGQAANDLVGIERRGRGLLGVDTELARAGASEVVAGRAPALRGRDKEPHEQGAHGSRPGVASAGATGREGRAVDNDGLVCEHWTRARMNMSHQRECVPALNSTRACSWRNKSLCRRGR